MEKGTFGIVMSYYREKYHLQRVAVYEGICSGTTYFRAEAEERSVDFALIEAMLARIGKEADRFELMMSDEDYELWTYRLELWAAMAGQDDAMVRKRVREYKRKMPAGGGIHEQFCLYCEMKLAEWDEAPGEAACQIARKALLITKREEDIPKRQQNLYSYIEMELLLVLIHHRYKRWGEYLEAEKCLLGILETVQICTAKNRRSFVEGKAWMELLALTEQYGNAARMYECVENAITCFAKSDGIGRLAQARFAKARLLWRTRGDAKPGEDRGTVCREECRMAWIIFRILGREQERDEVEKYCQEELQWHITTRTR